MKNEIEAQFLDINKAKIRKQLKAIGAQLIKPEVLMRRTVFYTGEHSFARVRDEGDKIVMTYKNVSDDYSILGTKEVNITVNDYDDAILFLRSCGLRVKAKQETKREQWLFGKVEISIDTWPWLPTFIEIEGPSEKSVWEVASKLGLDKSMAKYGSVDTTYRYYYGIETDVVNLHTPEILFDMTPPSWVNLSILESKKMNREDFLARLNSLNLPKNAYKILSGGSLLMHGLRQETADVDLLVTEKLAEKLELAKLPHYGNNICSPFKGVEMIVGNLDKIDKIDGYNCESLESVLEYKKRANRAKDQEDIGAIEAYLSK